MKTIYDILFIIMLFYPLLFWLFRNWRGGVILTFHIALLLTVSYPILYFLVFNDGVLTLWMFVFYHYVCWGLVITANKRIKQYNDLDKFTSKLPLISWIGLTLFVVPLYFSNRFFEQAEEVIQWGLIIISAILSVFVCVNWIIHLIKGFKTFMATWTEP